MPITVKKVDYDGNPLRGLTARVSLGGSHYTVSLFDLGMLGPFQRFIRFRELRGSSSGAVGGAEL